MQDQSPEQQPEKLVYSLEDLLKTGYTNLPRFIENKGEEYDMFLAHDRNIIRKLAKILQGTKGWTMNRRDRRRSEKNGVAKSKNRNTKRIFA